MRVQYTHAQMDVRWLFRCNKNIFLYFSLSAALLFMCMCTARDSAWYFFYSHIRNCMAQWCVKQNATTKSELTSAHSGPFCTNFTNRKYSDRSSFEWTINDGLFIYTRDTKWSYQNYWVSRILPFGKVLIIFFGNISDPVGMQLVFGIKFNSKNCSPTKFQRSNVSRWSVMIVKNIYYTNGSHITTANLRKTCLSSEHVHNWFWELISWLHLPNFLN